MMACRGHTACLEPVLHFLEHVRDSDDICVACAIERTSRRYQSKVRRHRYANKLAELEWSGGAGGRSCDLQRLV